MTAVEGFTGDSQCLAMHCHRPQVDSATCSSCSLFFSSPFLSNLFSPPPHPFSFPVPLFFHLFSPPPQPFSPLQQTSLLSLCLCSSEREALLFFCCKALLSIACQNCHSRQLKDQSVPEKVLV